MPHLLPHSPERRLRLLQDIALRLSAELSLRQILAGIAATLREAYGWDYVGCASIDPEAGQIRYEAHACAYALPEAPIGRSQPIGSGLLGLVALHGRVERCEHRPAPGDAAALIAGTRSEVCVPVLHQGEVIAVLDAQSRQPAAFTEHDVATLSLVAEMVAGSIAASRQLEAARQRAEVIGLLAEVSRAMLAEDDLDAMLQRLIDELARCFQLSLCTLCLVDQEHGPLVLRAYAGHSRYPLLRGAAWRSHIGVTGRAMRSGKRVHVPDVRQDPDYIEGNSETQAELVVPIRFREQILGLINMESRSPATFSPSNQLAMQAMADQAAGAIRLAMTMQRLQDANSAAETSAAALERSHRRLQRANARLREMSLRDALTGLGNRRRLDRGLRELWQEAQRHGTPIAALLLDIDHYKAFNDVYGHGAGDVCLRRVGRALRQAVRLCGAVVARYGGEEFAVILPNSDRSAALQMAESIHALIGQMRIEHIASPTDRFVTVSIGCASEIPQPVRLPEDLLQRADGALYAAKQSGRNRSIVAS